MRVSTIVRAMLAASAVAAGLSTASAQDRGPSQDAYVEPLLVLYSGDRFRGDVREIYGDLTTLNEIYFNDRARSLAVVSGVWEVCEHREFYGECAIVRYDIGDLSEIGLRRQITSARPIYEYTDAPHGLQFYRDTIGRIRYADAYNDPYYFERQGYGYSTVETYVFYGHTPRYRDYGYYDPRFGHGPYGFKGYRHNRGYGYGRGHGQRHHAYTHKQPPLRGHYGAKNADATVYLDGQLRGPSLGLNDSIDNLDVYRFNDKITSVDIRQGTWQLCSDANFRGRCQVVDASQGSLKDFRLNDNVSSIRRIDTPTGRGNGQRAGRGNRDMDARGARRGGGTVAAGRRAPPAQAAAPPLAGGPGASAPPPRQARDRGRDRSDQRFPGARGALGQVRTPPRSVPTRDMRRAVPDQRAGRGNNTRRTPRIEAPRQQRSVQPRQRVEQPRRAQPRPQPAPRVQTPQTRPVQRAAPAPRPAPPPRAERPRNTMPKALRNATPRNQGAEQQPR